MIHFTSNSTQVASLEEQLVERDIVLDDLKAHFIKSQQIMRLYEDSHRRELEFQEGDRVFLCLQPYRQVSLAGRANEKQSPRYYGPCTVNNRVGKVAYRFGLPPTAQLHNVPHFTAKEGNSQYPCLSHYPSHISPETVFTAEPESLFEVRTPDKGDTTSMEVLIKQKESPT